MARYPNSHPMRGGKYKDPTCKDLWGIAKLNKEVSLHATFFRLASNA